MSLGALFMNLPPILPSLKTIYGVTNAQIAFLVTSLIMTHGAVQVPSGVFTDRMGVKKTLLVSLVILFISSLLCVINTTYEFVLVMRIIGGIGTGFAFTSGIKYATLFTPEIHRGMIQGFYGASFSLGAIFPFFLMPLLIELDWKWVYLSTSLFFVLPIVLLVAWGKEMKPPSAIPLAQFKSVFSSKAVWILGALHAISLGGVLTLGTWFSSFAIYASHTDSLRIVGVWGAAVMFVSGVARLTGGFFLRKLSAIKIIRYSLLILLLSYLCLIFSTRFGYRLLFFGLAIYMSSSTFGPIFFLSFVVSGAAFAATGFGILNFIANLGSLFFPILFGYLIDLTGGFEASFWLMSGLVIIGMCLTFALRVQTK